jgi:hypothetical protein
MSERNRDTSQWINNTVLAEQQCPQEVRKPVIQDMMKLNLLEGNKSGEVSIVYTLQYCTIQLNGTKEQFEQKIIEKITDILIEAYTLDVPRQPVPSITSQRTRRSLKISSTNCINLNSAFEHQQCF